MARSAELFERSAAGRKRAGSAAIRVGRHSGSISIADRSTSVCSGVDGRDARTHLRRARAQSRSIYSRAGRSGRGSALQGVRNREWDGRNLRAASGEEGGVPPVKRRGRMRRPWNRLRYSDVTPKAVYLDRRRLMAGAAGLAAAALIPDLAGAARLATTPSAYSTDAKSTSIEAITSYNNFYEFGFDKGDPAKHAGRLTTEPWSVVIDGMVGRPGTYALEDIVAPARARGAHLPAALRRGLVDGDPLGGLSARRGARARRAAGRARSTWPSRPWCGRRRCRGSRAFPDARLALRRGAAARRGDAPADDPGGRALRRGAAEPERRAAPAGGAVEVRLQVDQVDRAHHR